MWGCGINKRDVYIYFAKYLFNYSLEFDASQNKVLVALFILVLKGMIYYNWISYNWIHISLIRNRND